MIKARPALADGILGLPARYRDPRADLGYHPYGVATTDQVFQ
jgi:hypothetical protein